MFMYSIADAIATITRPSTSIITTTATVTRPSTSIITTTATVTYTHTSNTSAFITATIINSTMPLSENTNSSIVGVIVAITVVFVVIIIIIVIVTAIIFIRKKNKSKQHIEKEDEYYNINDNVLPRPLTDKLEPVFFRMDSKESSNEPQYVEMLTPTKQLEVLSEDQIKMQDNPSYFIYSKHEVKHQVKIQDNSSSKYQIEMQDNPAYLISSKDQVKVEDNPSYHVVN